MSTPLEKLSPSQAWSEALARSMAIGIAGWAVAGGLQAIGVIPTLYRPALVPATSLVATYLTALTAFLAHYHRRWILGALGALLSLLVPFGVNLMWARMLRLSLLYPLVFLPLVGTITLAVAHHRNSGPDPDIDALVQKITENVEPLPWIDGVLLLGITAGLIVLVLVNILR